MISESPSQRIVLLTGASGTLGSALLPELLSNGDVVYCLIRSQNSDHLISRTQKIKDFLIKNYEIKNINNAHWISGNTEKTFLGLQQTQYNELSKKITHIIHCAADLDFLLPPSKACSQTLIALDSILEILSQNKSRNIKLEYISTVGVGGTNKGTLLENRINDQSDFFNSYEMAKFVSEQLLYKKMDEGYSITIHRPSMILGNSKNGSIIHHQIFYFLVKLISGELSYGIYPTGLKASLDTVPNDYCAKVILESSKEENSSGKIYHLSSSLEKSISLSYLQKTSQEILNNINNNKFKLNSDHTAPKLKLPKLNFGIPINTLQSISYLKYLTKTNGKWRKRLELLPMLVSYSNQIQNFENKNTLLFCQSKNINLPSPNEYIPIILNKYWDEKK